MGGVQLGPRPLQGVHAVHAGPDLGAPLKEDLVAYGRCVHRDGSGFWADVDGGGASSRRIVACGTVMYRIVIDG